MYQSTHYRTLFELYIRHGYLLDDGADTFNSLAPAGKAAALRRYNFEDLFEIVPTEQTAATMVNLRLLLKKTNQGFTMIAQTKEGSLLPVTGINQDTKLVFLLKIRHPRLSYFTNLEFEKNRILLFPNNQPAQIPATVPKVPLENASQLVNDTFLLSETDSQAMLEAYTTEAERSGVVGMLWLNARGSTALRDLIDANGQIMLDPGADPPVAPPRFKIHFETRSTFWRYIRESATFSATTLNPQPLTRYGYIGLDPATDFLESPLSAPESNFTFPNPMLEIFEYEAGAYYSVIFI